MGHRDFVTNDSIRTVLTVLYVLYIQMSNKEPSCWAICLSRACFITQFLEEQALLLSTIGERVEESISSFKNIQMIVMYYSVRKQIPQK